MIMRGKGAGSFMQVKELMEETVGQGNNGECCRLATSVACNSGREIDGATFPGKNRGTRFGE